MEKNRIALVTCYFKNNYGSQLQAYATEKIIKDMGYDYETINILGFKKVTVNAYGQ